MTISDRVLSVMEEWLLVTGDLPAAVRGVRCRDSAALLDGPYLVLDADEPEQHEVMRGMERLDGRAVLSVSLDDVREDDDRRWMLGVVEELLRKGAGDPVVMYDEWVALEDRGVRVFGFEVQGSTWESDERRMVGTVAWTCWACAAA